ncbi:MAG: DUF167 domain-containing protein [Treponema sp.]|jgi:uncharacterized protein (TIGR00251 family)|nr:DUF167 domain-containing protein [Treponema sp.]
MEEGIRTAGDRLLLDIKVLPGASKNEFAGIKEGRLRVKIAAPPEDGKANGELISFFAKTLGCAKRELSLVRGEKSRIKTLGVPLQYREELEKILGSFH